MESTAVIYQKGKKAFVAGLSWQPLSSASYGAKVAEIRELAERVDATRVVELDNGDGGLFVGLYNYDADLSDEKRTNQVYSIAAQVAATAEQENLIFVWKLADQYQTHKATYWAVIVIENGAPSLDLLAPENEAFATIESYLQMSLPNGQTYTVFSNEPLPKASATLIDDSFLEDGFSKAGKLVDVPTNMVTMGALLGFVLLLAGGLFFGNEYLEEQKKQERMVAMQKAAETRIQTPAYLEKLAVASRSVGLTSAQVLELLDRLLEQPFVARGWQLKAIECNLNDCKASWQSNGGYTKELISFLNNQTALPTGGNFQSLSFQFKYTSIPPVALPARNALVESKGLKVALFDEQQAWVKAQFTHTVDVNGGLWPSGYTGIPPEVSVFRHPVSINTSLELVRDFMQRYGSAIFWDQVKLDINPGNVTAPINISMKGAFYAR